jgi:hypothetical protein
MDMTHESGIMTVADDRRYSFHFRSHYKPMACDVYRIVTLADTNGSDKLTKIERVTILGERNNVN